MFRILVLLIALLCFSAVSFAQEATSTMETVPVPVVDATPIALGVDLPTLVIIGLLLVIIGLSLTVYKLAKLQGIMLDPNSVKEILAPAYALLDKYLDNAATNAAKTPTPIDDLVVKGMEFGVDYSRRFVEVDNTPIKPEI